MKSPAQDWTQPFDLLREKWVEIPVGAERRKSSDMLQLPMHELWTLWQESRNEVAEGDFGCRGWYYSFYKDVLRDKRVLDVGSGFGYDGITFALAGARVTFLDIVESNLAIVRRLCEYRQVANADFFYMSDLDSLAQLQGQFDIIWCCGSLINLPFILAQRESQELLRHLVPHGRWIELAYPQARWEREGRLPFERWGERTDGGAPWMEWYDLKKMLARLAPHQFRVVLQFSFHNDDFNWFDLEHVA